MLTLLLVTKLFNKLPNNKPSLKLARDAAIEILSLKERKLCEVLINALGEGYQERDDTPPDVSTALKRMAILEDMSPELYQVLEAFMQAGPCRTAAFSALYGVRSMAMSANIFAFLSINSVRRSKMTPPGLPIS